MKVPFFNFKKSFLSYENEINEAVKNVFLSGWYILGKELEKFENKFADYCGAKFCIGVGNGLDALKIIMSSDEKTLNTFIQDFHKKFTSVNPEQIAFPRSVNGLRKYMDSGTTFKKGTPMHIKGCLIYNHKIKQNKLIHQYPLIQEEFLNEFALNVQLQKVLF